MAIAQFKIGDAGVLNLAGLSIQYGDVNAVTLIDVIVFASEADAYNNPALWAHELTHVKQYRDWGLHSFAISYARNASDVEAPAYSVGNSFNQWRANNRFGPQTGPFSRGPFSQGPFPAVTQPGFLSGFVMVGCGCYGPTLGYSPEPRCQSGGVRAAVCSVACAAGGWQYAWVCQ
jgi:hypothetical protein